MSTDAEYQALKRATLLRENRTVEFEERKVEYVSFAEMERRLHAIERELIKQQKRPGAVRGVFRQWGLIQRHRLAIMVRTRLIKIIEVIGI